MGHFLLNIEFPICEFFIIDWKTHNITEFIERYSSFQIQRINLKILEVDRVVIPNQRKGKKIEQEVKVKVEAEVEVGVGIEIEGAEVILVEVKVLMSIQEIKQALFKRSANIEQGMIHLNLVAGIAENQEGIYSSFSITIK